MQTVTLLITAVINLSEQESYHHPLQGQESRNLVKTYKAQLAQLLAQYGFRNDGNTARFINEQITMLIRDTIAERGIYAPTQEATNMTFTHTKTTEPLEVNKIEPGEDSEGWTSQTCACDNGENCIVTKRKLLQVIIREDSIFTKHGLNLRKMVSEFIRTHKNEC